MKRKRILALFMSLCLVAGLGISELPAKAETGGGYSLNENKVLYTLSEKKCVEYYSDSLDTSEGYTKALGSYANYSYTMPWTNGVIQASSNTLQHAFFNGITDGNNLQNYTVGAEVTYTGTEKGPHFSVIAYGQGNGVNSNTVGYEFSYLAYGNSNAQPYFRLAYRDGGSVTQFGTSGGELWTYVKTEFTTYTLGDNIIMSLQVNTNEDGSVTLKCYAEHKGVKKEVLTYTDTTATANGRNTKGLPGFRTTTTAVTADNIFVYGEQKAESILYEDDFSNASGYAAAIGSGTESWDVNTETGVLATTTNNAFAMFNGIENASTLQDYTVSADVTLTTSNKYNGIIAYGHSSGSNTYGYEFAIVSGQFRLYRRVGASGEPLVGGNANYDVIDFFDNYKVGETVRLSLTAMSNANGSVSFVGRAAYEDATEGKIEKIILTHVDESPETYGLAAGTAGVRTNDTGGATVDNISVVRCESLQFVEDFDNADKMKKEEYWSNTSLSLEDGAAVLTEADAAYLTGIQSATTWKDYVYEADVSMATPIDATSKTATAALVVGGTNTSSGYEFALMHAGAKNTYSVRLYDRGTPGSLDSKTYTFSFEETVKLKMVVDTTNSKLTCYANGELVCTADVAVTGTIGFRTTGTAGVTGGGIFDNISVMPIEGNHYDVSTYRSSGTDGSYTSYPTKTGYVFGGWYTDAQYTVPLASDKTTDGAYAKWVDEDVLTVKAQITSGTTAASESTNLRLLTTVDSLNYQSVGFTVKRGDTNATKEVLTNTVYEEVIGIDDNGTYITYTPDTSFSAESAYFMVCTFMNPGLPKEDFGVELTVTPKWITNDGTTVTGTAKTFKISDGFSAQEVQ